MSRVIPAVVAVVAIAVLTVVEGRMSDRWGDNRHCGYCATLLDDVPKQVGSWMGTDNEVTAEEREGSGAKGYVSRLYRHSSTREEVGVWFIVGHARDTFRHTPDICYGGSGFETEGEQDRHDLDLGDGKKASFWTSVFVRDTGIGPPLKQRVFWSWFRPRAGSGDPVEWVVPDEMGGAAIRYEFAAAPALYKLYFTTSGAAAESAGDQSVCMEFAREFLAAVEPLLAPANAEIPDTFAAK